MKKFTLATLALAMGTALIAAPQGTDKSKAPATSTEKGGEKGKGSKKGKNKGEKNKEKEKGTKLHEHTN